MPATDPEQRIESPCVRLCTLDLDDICMGCFRSIDEICAWGSADNEQRRQIVAQAEKRAQGRQRG